jgi:Na+-translocating ferredoxin:NAD+ oxidoreductase RnfG subunit
MSVLTYNRKAEITKSFNPVVEATEFTKTAVYVFKRDGVEVGRAVVRTTWREGYSGRVRLRKWFGAKFRHDWEVTLLGHSFTIPGIRCKDEVLAEVKRKLTLR